jgi:hypothetical protein
LYIRSDGGLASSLLKDSLWREKRSRGLKLTLIFNASRGAEAPLFHLKLAPKARRIKICFAADVTSRVLAALPRAASVGADPALTALLSFPILPVYATARVLHERVAAKQV